MLELNRRFEIHCNRDMDKPLKEVAWYVLVTCETQWQMNKIWKTNKLSKAKGYRKAVVVETMEIIK